MANQETKERPTTCPDNSRNTIVQKFNPLNLTYEEEALGGCASVAGWGNRYRQDERSTGRKIPCRTDYSDFAPAKAE